MGSTIDRRGGEEEGFLFSERRKGAAGQGNFAENWKRPVFHRRKGGDGRRRV